jgi:hypothetical protein
MPMSAHDLVYVRTTDRRAGSDDDPSWSVGRNSTTNGGRDMGIHDRGIVQQAKKGQGETNQRLDALIAEQRRTNELLHAILTTLGNWLERRV